jgi:hypothetical protein
MSQQGLRQASVRAVTGTAETYEGDWLALFDQAGIAAGMLNERLLRWINYVLDRTYTNLPEAQQAFAAANGAYDWASLGTFIPAPAGYGFLTLDGSTLTLSGNPLILASS